MAAASRSPLSRPWDSNPLPRSYQERAHPYEPGRRCPVTSMCRGLYSASCRRVSRASKVGVKPRQRNRNPEPTGRIELPLAVYKTASTPSGGRQIWRTSRQLCWLLYGPRDQAEPEPRGGLGPPTALYESAALACYASAAYHFFNRVEELSKGRVDYLQDLYPEVQYSVIRSARLLRVLPYYADCPTRIEGHPHRRCSLLKLQPIQGFTSC